MIYPGDKNYEVNFTVSIENRLQSINKIIPGTKIQSTIEEKNS